MKLGLSKTDYPFEYFFAKATIERAAAADECNVNCDDGNVGDDDDGCGGGDDDASSSGSDSDGEQTAVSGIVYSESSHPLSGNVAVTE